MISAAAVLLDLDGTLLDTVADLTAAANAMLAELERPPLAEEEIRAYVGRGIPNLVKRVLAGHLEAADDPAPPPAEALASFRRHYARVNGLQTRPFPQAREGLAALKAKDLPLAVITNKARDFTVPLLQRTGLAPYFDLVVAGDDLPRQKPDPMPLVWACGRFAVSPSDAVFIGDSIHDFESARAASCQVLLVPYGYNEGRDVRTLAADAIVTDVLAAASLIKKR